MKRSELFFAILMVPLDFLMILAGFLLAYYVRDSGLVLTLTVPGHLGHVVQYGSLGDIMPLVEYLRYVLYIIPAMLLIFAATGLYALRGSMPWTKRITRIFIGTSMGLFFILLLFLFRNSFFLPRATVIYAWIFATLLVIAGRLGIRLVQRILRRWGIGVIRLAIIGKSDAAPLIMKNLASAHSQYRLEACFDSPDVESVLAQLNADAIDELIVVNESYDTNALVTIRNHCLEHQVTFCLIPALMSVLQSSSFSLRTEVGFPMIEVRPTPLEGWGRIAKRLFDILAACFFIVLFSPLFVIIATWMKLSSPGPLIYKHGRIGKGMQPIEVWKFRSMQVQFCDGPGYVGAEAFKKYLSEHPDQAEEFACTSKLKHDPRVSSIGQFLRVTSLDELPQFFNVLFGTLSLVGPRPIIRNDLNDEVAKYGEAARLLFTVKPGLTGLWQVSGRNDVTFAERIALDTRYIEHWSIWWDIWIVLKTVTVFIPKKNNGAY